jgi:3-oxoacyl-[acyl-carrier protein] reductase
MDNNIGSKSLNRKVVVITGASRGIGRATAEYFALNGWEVVVNYNNSEEKAIETVSKITSNGGNATAFKADVALPAEVKKLIEYSISLTGRIDALINNAAISEFGLFCDLSPERERRLFDVNLFAPMNLCREVLPHMIHEKSGAIVNISSMWGQVGASCEVHYSTAKAALIGFTKALAKEVAPSGIRVNCVAPGVISTDMNQRLTPSDIDSLTSEIPMSRLGTPVEVAECIYFLCNSATYVTGQVLSPNGGMIC